MPTDPARRARPLRALVITLALAASAYAIERRVHAPASASAPLAAPVAAPPGFDAVDMHAAGPADLDRAFAWRAVRVSGPLPGEVGEVAVALTPADGAPPLLWFPQRRLVQPVLPPSGAAPGARVTELGTFQSGLAPARLESPGGTPAAWGYVDAGGRWVIAPRFTDAGSFVGGVASADEPGGPELIDLRGHPLPWQPEDTRNTAGATMQLSRLGRWTRITQPGAWVVVDNGRAAGEPNWVSDDTRVIRVPGVNAKASADGELWLIDTAAGPRLWAPAQGFVAAPAGFTPTLPLARDLFLAPSRKDGTSALVALDGRVVADPAPIVAALTPRRFLACTGSAADAAFNPADGARTLGPDLPDGRCGILDDEGRWWLPPDYRTVDRWGDDRVVVQGELQSCVVALHAPVAGCETGDGPSPRLDLGRATPRLYRYVDHDGNDASPARYTGAWPYTGGLAEATVQGLPGLVDVRGNWLTPRPAGDVFARAQQSAAILRQRGFAPGGSGVIDRAGHWVVPPVFDGLWWLADGTLRACPAGAGVYDTACEHLDAAGKPLDTPAGLPPPEVATPPSAAASASGPASDAPVAVALDGRWGYRDARGDWTIAPRFDDATDFDGDRAAAAVDVAASAPPADGSPASTRRWGLIGRDGRWIAEPRFARLDRFQGPVAVAGENGLLGLVDRDGHWLAQPGFAAIEDFADGVAIARRPDGSLCALDAAGRCSGETGLTALRRGADRWAIGTRTQDGVAHDGYLDAQRHWVIEPRFLHAEPFRGELAIARAELPAPPADWPARWVAVDIRHHPAARLYAVGAVHPSGRPARPAEPDPVRFALADDHGRWLLPSHAAPAGK